MKKPNSDATLYNYGIVLKALNRPFEALERLSQALTINASVAETWNNRGIIFHELKRYREAVADFDRAISLYPNYSEAYYNRGNALAHLKVYDQALAAYDRALALKPDLAEAWLGRGNALIELKRDADAILAYDKALALKPRFAEAWLCRGNMLATERKYDNALVAYTRALTIKPDLAEAWLGRGNVCNEVRQYDDAAVAFDRALALSPNLAEAWLGRGNIWTGVKQYDRACAAFETALNLKPDLAKAWLGRGRICTERGRHDDALIAYDRALALDPDLNYGAGARLDAKLHVSDWVGLNAEVTRLLAAVRVQKPSCLPFSILKVPSLPADQLKCARRYVQDQPCFPALWRDEIYSHNRIRIAYLSADFREHPTAFQTAGLFEQHNKLRFEVTGISFGPGDNSPMRLRLERAFERFLDVQSQSDQAIAELLHELEIDILVDLMGFTEQNRLGVLARRAAPIQVNYLGYPGTMGADYINYILADSTVIPEEHCTFYAEQVIWLPDSYQINDDRRQISEHVPSRFECGLPESAFVFCCFNNTFKITPQVFDIWMRLLTATNNSVLWLIEGNSSASANLRQEAEKRGVSAQRLIFAPGYLFFTTKPATGTLTCSWIPCRTTHTRRLATRCGRGCHWLPVKAQLSPDGLGQAFSKQLDSTN